MSEVRFRIAYRGPALEDGSMDVRDLAPALLAVGESAVRANRLLNGSAADVDVRVQADFRHGSFEVYLSLFQKITSDPVIDIISDANKIAEAVGWAVAGVAGSIALIKASKGRKPEKIEEIPDGNIQVTYNECTIVTTGNALMLSQDQPFREAMHKTLAPLRTDGIDVFEIGDGEQIFEQIPSEEVENFAPLDPDEGEPLIDNTHDAAYEIITPHFADGYKWRLGSEGGYITALVDDTEFLENVDAGLHAFRKGDILKVTIRQRAWQKPSGGLHHDNVILKVLDHIERPDPRRPTLPPIDWDNQEPPTETGPER